MSEKSIYKDLDFTPRDWKKKERAPKLKRNIPTAKDVIKNQKKGRKAKPPDFSQRRWLFQFDKMRSYASHKVSLREAMKDFWGKFPKAKLRLFRRWVPARLYRS